MRVCVRFGAMHLSLSATLMLIGDSQVREKTCISAEQCRITDGVRHMPVEVTACAAFTTRLAGLAHCSVCRRAHRIQRT
jgi:hypothetical protein